MHDKGLSIISALASVLGQETFNRAYLRALKEFGGRALDWHDFEKLCEQESGQNLQWFFDQWVRSDRFLSYQVTSQDCKKENDEYQSEVKIKQLGTLPMPVPVAVDFADGSHQMRSSDRLADITVLKFKGKFPVTAVRLDPNDDLALVVPPPAMTRATMSTAINQLDGADAKQALICSCNRRE